MKIKVMLLTALLCFSIVSVADEPLVINGYVLPPEPDPDVNNATLLGVDANDNGVRDDVERWIIIKYKDHHKIVTAIGLQGAKAAQVIIQEPENARQTREVFAQAYHCSFYFEFYAGINNEPLLVDHPMFGNEFENIQFNTTKRARAYGRYNAALSGGVYTSPSSAEKRAGCDFDVDALLGN